MKQFLQKMLLWACMLVPLIGVSQEFNYSCDFENDGSLWTYLNGTSTNKWVKGTAVHNGLGSHSLYISSDTNGVTHDYNVSSSSKSMAYQTLMLEAGNYEYSYDWMCGGEGNYDYMRVMLVPSTVDLVENSANGINHNSLPSGWIALDGGSKLNGQDSWSSITGSVQVATSGSYKLLVYWTNDYSGGAQPPAAIDNIGFVVPTCPTPTEVVVTNISADSAVVGWNEVGSAATWVVTYYPSGFTSSSDVAITRRCTETHIVLEGLAYSTDYIVEVKADCGGDESFKAVATFRSACGPMVLPFMDDFDGCVVDQAPSCWNVLGNGNVRVVEKNDSKVVRFSSGGMLASSKVPLAGNMVELNFTMSCEGSRAGSMQIGFVSDLTNLDGMVVVKTITPVEMNSFSEYEVDFATMGEGVTDEGYIVFKQVDNSSNYYYYWIDDVTIKQRSDCRRPESMSVSNITYNSATLSWDLVEGVTAYEVLYGVYQSPDDPDNHLLSDITTNSVDLSGLSSDVKYYVWVRSVCGEEVTSWRSGGYFYTQVACAQPMNVNITNLSIHGAAINWEFNSVIGRPVTAVQVAYRVENSEAPYTVATTTNNYYIISGLDANTTYEYQLRTICSTDSAEVFEGSFHTLPCGYAIDGGTDVTTKVPTYMWDEYSYSQMLYTASELVGLDSIYGVAFNYTEGVGNVRTLDVYVGNVSDSTLNPESPIALSSMTKVGTNVSLEVKKGWCTIMFDSSFVYDGTSNLVVAIDDNTGHYASSASSYYHTGGTSLYKSGWGNINPGAVTDMRTLSGVPDIIFCTTCQSNQCMAPLLTLSAIASTSASLVWVPGDVDNRWVVEYKLDTDELWTIAETTTNTFATINNLEVGSLYEFRVGSICGNDTLYSSVSAFTKCAAIPVPYIDDFELSTLNPCITLGNSNGGSLPYHNRGLIRYGYSSYGYVILPEFQVPLNTLRLEYTIESYVGNMVVVYAGTDPNDWNTFVPVDTVSIISEDYEELHYTYFNNYHGNGHYIAIQAISSDIYLNAVAVDVKPLGAVPMDVTASQVTYESAVVAWDGDNGSSDYWLVQYQNMVTNDTIVEVAYETTFTLTSLASDSPYEVMVYNVYGEDTIAALFPVKFRTSCSAIELPFIESFENKPIYEFPSCWTLYSGESEVYYRHTTHGERSLQLNESAVVFSPKVPLPGNRIALDFLLKNDSPDAGKIVVGFTTDVSNLINMQVVDTINPVDTDVHLYELDFSNITATEEGYIVWKQIDMATDWYADETEYYLDYVFIREVSPYSRPAALRVSNVKYDRALLSWTPVDNVTTYEVMYGTENDINAASNSIQLSSYDTLTITGLSGSTTYYAWVRSVYGNDYSDWRAADAFTTQVGCARLADVNVVQTTTKGISINWSYDKSVGAPATQVSVCWKDNADSVYNSAVTSNDYYIINDLQPGITYELKLQTICSHDTADEYIKYITTNNCGVIITDSNSFNIANIPTSCNWGYTYSQLLYPASELVGVDTIKAISFEWNSDVVDSRNIDLYMGHTAVDRLTSGYALSLDQLTLVDSAASLKVVRGWCHIELATPFVYHSDSNLVIAIDDNTGSYPRGSSKYFLGHAGSSIYCHSDRVNPSPSASHDYTCLNEVPNIMISNTCDANLCESPLLALDHTTDSSALLLWGHANVGSSWQVEYKQKSDIDWTIAHNHVTDTFALINGLNASTYYQFRVATNCNDGLQYSYVEGFTDCGIVTAPYTENFNQATLNPCWIYGNRFVMNDIPSRVDSSLFMSTDTNSFAILPEFSNDVNTLHAFFTIKSNHQNNSIVVMAGTDASDFTSFVAIDTFYATQTDVAISQLCNLDSYSGNGHYIAFYAPEGNIYIDNINIYTVPSCDQPQYLASENITDHSAHLSWQGTALAYEFGYRAQGTSQWTSFNLSENFYDLDSLQASTTYEWRVRACCSELNSDWDTSTFTTLAPPCLVPTHLSIDSITHCSAHLSWLGNASEYELSYRLLGETQWTVVSLTETSYTLTALSSDTIYQWRVCSHCNDTYSDWADTLFRTLENPCAAPTHLTISDITHNAATISWQGDATAYELEYCLQGTNDWVTINLSETSFILTNLQSITDYKCRVRAHCDESYSEWTFAEFATLNLLCEIPSVVVSNITREGATFTWNAGENHQAWEVNVFNTIINETYDVTETSYVISGLEHATEYQVAVRAKCAEDVYSDWSDTVSFTTLDCLPVSGVAISEITKNSAKVTWTAGAEETAWQINYGLQDFGQGEGLMVDATATNYTLTGLAAETAYDVYVRAMCSEDFYSVWSEVVRFTTLDFPEGIDGVEGNFQFTIYPNPTSNATTISLNGVEGKVEISVVDMNGRTVANEAIECGVDCEKRIDVSGLSQGTYFVRVLGDNINSVRKLIVR